VGITVDVGNRAADHLKKKGISNLTKIPFLENLTVSDAKAVEEAIMMLNGGPRGRKG